MWDEFSQYGDVLLELAPTGSMSYVYGRAQLLSQKVGSSAHTYLLPDVQFSTRLLTDATGNVVQQYTYSAFGELADGVTPATRYLYTGQQYEASTQLYNLRARSYAPETGRFLSRDTWAYNFQNPMELNRYVYAAGNPVRWDDPSGYTALSGDYRGLLTKIAGATIIGLNRFGTQISQAYGYVYATISLVSPQIWIQVDDYLRTLLGAAYMESFIQLRAELARTQTQAKAKEKEKTKNNEIKYYFRGTTEGFAGGSTAQTLGVTSTSTQPGIATIFATVAESVFGGRGVVYIASSQDLSGVGIGGSNWLSNLEQEVVFDILPLDFARLASKKISARRAREILSIMGRSIPSYISLQFQNLELTGLIPLTKPEILAFVVAAQ